MQKVHFIKTARNLVLIGAAMALFGQVSPVSAGPKYLNETELLETFPGRTISSVSKNGVAWTQTYSAANKQKKGNINVVFGGQAGKSKWFVKDGQWCENWGDGQACWLVERVGKKSLRIYENGKPKKNLWNLN